ncbi:hypothetical protein DFH07DRAFT_768662 [Mycena maculata]|uniref:Uncharacterized protein n=1 Tax=Mycena maculata TaxID=230809 RepID=A0AAD7JSH1_9AGAR|nr:hypothetical protein DFH07DRAFT_768662 [Mycena maculata]
MQNDGTAFAVGITNLSAFLTATFDGLVTATEVHLLYPGLNDSTIITEIIKDFLFLCPAELWSGGHERLLLFPGAGAWHSSELFEVFGTFNRSTATAAEATLSGTMQTLIANFIKDPMAEPVPNWPKYVLGNTTTTLVMLAYSGNVVASNVVQAVESDPITLLVKVSPPS